MPKLSESAPDVAQPVQPFNLGWFNRAQLRFRYRLIWCQGASVTVIYVQRDSLLWSGTTEIVGVCWLI
ncbi:hypothetical protein ABIF16_008152 [Bradyrhizobium elkanii]